MKSLNKKEVDLVGGAGICGCFPNPYSNITEAADWFRCYQICCSDSTRGNIGGFYLPGSLDFFFFSPKDSEKFECRSTTKKVLSVGVSVSFSLFAFAAWRIAKTNSTAKALQAPVHTSYMV